MSRLDDDDAADTLPRDATMRDPITDGAADTLQATAASLPSSRSPAPPALAGTSARYVLGQVIGRGGMGEVRLARDPRIDRDVAVKVMRDPNASPEAVSRFLREARVQGRLDHPAVVPVHDLGVDERGAPYFAMKRLTGTTLADAIEALRTGDPAAAARWPRRLLLDRLADVCLAVEFAHERGVVHRDLKPSNLMLGDYGEAFVLDWGIARLEDDDTASGLSPRTPPAQAVDAGLGATTPPTAAGSLLGTPGYMAPEQMRGERIDRRVDVYALGCVLFEILTLAPALPHGVEAFEATLSAQAHRPRVRCPDAEVPPELDEACARATAPEAAERTPTARALADSIQAYLAGDRDLARRRELAQAHADAAERAWTDDDSGRAAAMREAGRALAIDPGCADAQHLLGRLLLTPPTVPVPAVRRAVEHERVEASQVQLRTASRIYLVFMLIMPGLLALGMRASWPLIAVWLLSVVNFGLMTWGSRRVVLPVGLTVLAVISHLAQLALAGILFGPLLVLPAFAVGSIASFTSFPRLRRSALIVIGHLVAIATPFVLEALGLVPSTFSLAGDRVVLHPWATGVDAWLLVACAIASVMVQTLATAAMTIHYRTAQEDAQDKVHLHSWHLKQLVPDEV